MSGFTRRGFLGVGSGAVAAAALPFASVAAQDRSPNGTLLVIHLTGGVDGLAVLVPDGDVEFAATRPSIAVAPVGTPGGALPFVAGWGLHPALGPVLNAAGPHLAVVGGVGFVEGHRVRSHRRALRLLRHGRPGPGPSGWATRLFDDLHLPVSAGAWLAGGAGGVFDGVAVFERGDDADPFSGHASPDAARLAMTAAYTGSFLEHSAEVALTAGHRSRAAADPVGRGYPDSDAGRALAAVADWLRAPDPPLLAAIEIDGFDTHRGQGDGTGGVLAARLDHTARALANFWAEIEAVRSATTVIVVSEFGRSIGENRIGGTNHGDAGVALVIDEAVRPGLHGAPSWPGAGGRNDGWPVTVDTRRLLLHLLAHRGFDADDDLFPTIGDDDDHRDDDHDHTAGGGTPIGLF